MQPRLSAMFVRPEFNSLPTPLIGDYLPSPPKSTIFPTTLRYSDDDNDDDDYKDDDDMNDEDEKNTTTVYVNIIEPFSHVFQCFYIQSRHFSKCLKPQYCSYMIDIHVRHAYKLQLTTPF